MNRTIPDDDGEKVVLLVYLFEDDAIAIGELRLKHSRAIKDEHERGVAFIRNRDLGGCVEPWRGAEEDRSM